MKYTNVQEVFARVSAEISEIQKATIPPLLAKKATTFFQNSFVKKGWDGAPWQETKKPVKTGSLMLRSGNLRNSIRPTEVNSQQIIITAGTSKVSYAKIHNEGGTIQTHARSETFIRNRHSKGKNIGRFAEGTKPGHGFTHKSGTIKIPKRQFMGDSPLLDKQLAEDIITAFKPVLKH